MLLFCFICFTFPSHVPQILHPDDVSEHRQDSGETTAWEPPHWSQLRGWGFSHMWSTSLLGGLKMPRPRNLSSPDKLDQLVLGYDRPTHVSQSLPLPSWYSPQVCTQWIPHMHLCNSPQAAEAESWVRPTADWANSLQPSLLDKKRKHSIWKGCPTINFVFFLKKVD